MVGSRTVLGAVFGGTFLAGLWLAPGFPFLGADEARAQNPPQVAVPEVPSDQGDQEAPAETGTEPDVPEEVEPAPEEPAAPEPPEPAAPVEVPTPAPTFQGVAPPPGFAQPPGGAPSSPGTARASVEGNLVNLDFNEADIQDVVKQISEITGRNFILDERVRGKITIISPGKVTIPEAYKVFESALNVKGFTTIPAGKFLKIVPLREAKEGNIATYPEGSPVPERDTYVTRLIPLRYVDATDISNSLKPLVSRDASMIPYAPTNTIILSDSSYNINKILDIIRQVDVASYQETLEIIQLKYAAASDIAEEISQVFGESQQGGGAGGAGGFRRIRQAGVPVQPGQAGPKIITDERTNSLIILASPRQIDDIRGLIRRLDYQTGRGRIHVYYLENADAKELAETLASLGVGEGGGGAGKGATGASAQGQPGGVPAAVAATVAELGEGVKITHDEPTNALIIESSPEAYETIKEVIEKLDIKRPQVLVEALLLEVSIGPNSLSTGVSLEGGNRLQNTGNGQSGLFGSTADSVFPSGGSGLFPAAGINALLNSSGAATPLLPLLNFSKTVTVRTPGPDGKPGTADDTFAQLPVIQAAIQAASIRTDTNILSAPNILTTDNQEAEIQVGQNIPIQTAAVSSTASATGNVSDNTLVNNSFERQDIGVILKVTPQISEGDNVRLEISNEITEVAEQEAVGLPTLTKRSLKNVVYVADGATVVVGGIISSKLDKSSSRVPWLGDIPGLGWAFKNKSKSLRKINLIVFLTPHIVRSPGDLRKVTNYKQKEFETKSREALRKTGEEERRERETEAKARAEGKSVEDYEEKYNLNRARSPVDQALKDIKTRNRKQGEAAGVEAPKATPGRHEEVIGTPESKAPEDATGHVIAEGAGEAPPTLATPESEAPPAAAPARTASIPSGNYTVQVGAFPDRNQAERLTDQLKDKHYDVYMTSGVVTGGGVVHRVRVGRFESEAQARQIAGKLQKDLSGEETVPFVVKLAE